MRPLDPLSSIKTKLGVVIVAVVGVVVLTHSLGLIAQVPLALVGLASGGLALGIVQVLARGMTSPLREMVRAAKAMARGDYSQRVTATSRDEVGDLARAFNTMASELEQVDRMRKDLLANVSHELRTPIGALQAVLENLVDGVATADEETLKTMLDQVERLGRLVSQLLDLSRLESGVVPLETSEFEIRPLLEQVVKESTLQAFAVEISLTVEPPRLKAKGDPERLHQVVANLLDNAVRHSPRGGTVALVGRGSSNKITIEVTDEGPGIPDTDRAKVFERFYRADAARTRDGGGTGLGLAIARWIVEMHGGDIRVEDGIPKGCRMIVELPGRAA